MSAEEVRAKVVEMIRETTVGDKPITDETLLECDLGLDLLDTVELIMAIEDELGINIDDESIDGTETVTVGDVVKAAQAAAGAAGKEGGK